MDIIGSLILLGLFLYIFGCGVWYWIVKPHVNVKAPAKKIIRLISKEDGFFVSDNEGGGFLIVDTVLERESVITRLCLMDSTVYRIEGDLQWMSNYEGKILYNTILKLIVDRTRKQKDMEEAVEQISKNSLREEAKKVYKDR